MACSTDKCLIGALCMLLQGSHMPKIPLVDATFLPSAKEFLELMYAG